jgi:formamidopyrimidine-DNA glycosylase
MPELPDVTLYVERLAPLVVGQTLQRGRQAPSCCARSSRPWPAPPARDRGEPPGQARIVFELDGKLFLVPHLMVAGRLRWRPAGAAIPGRNGLAASPGRRSKAVRGTIGKRPPYTAVTGRTNPPWTMDGDRRPE